MGKRGPGRRIRAAGVIGAEAGAVLAWDYEMGLCDVDSDIGSIPRYCLRLIVKPLWGQDSGLRYEYLVVLSCLASTSSF